VELEPELCLSSKSSKLPNYPDDSQFSTMESSVQVKHQVYGYIEGG
jgi:hypothetical protein